MYPNSQPHSKLPGVLRHALWLVSGQPCVVCTHSSSSSHFRSSHSFPNSLSNAPARITVFPDRNPRNLNSNGHVILEITTRPSMVTINSRAWCRTTTSCHVMGKMMPSLDLTGNERLYPFDSPMEESTQATFTIKATARPGFQKRTRGPLPP
eukprot:3119195-Rhodomonas_salina.2